jgi:Fic family protein
MKIPMTPPSQDKLMKTLSGSSPDRIIQLVTMRIGPEQNGRYFHWDELRHREPPQGLSHEEWWFAIKQARSVIRKDLTLKDQHDNTFGLVLTGGLQKKLHNIDRDAAGTIQMDVPIATSQSRDRYLIRSLFEEAITSSQLEGASTTTSEAKKMLRSGRKPRDRSEQMILNNYQAIQFVRENRSEPLTENFLLELHDRITYNTMDIPDASGRWRKASEDTIVVDSRDGTLLHRPPHADLIPSRMKRLIEFANSDQDDSFIHPVIRAVILHFMLSFEHPFADGNGRTARALFYWYMIQSGYWLIEFVSISKVIKSAPAKYSKAFLYAETDENDLTYFMHHQFNVITKSINDLHKYLSIKAKEVQTTEQLLRGPVQRVLNHRQINLITHALKHPNHLYDIQSHQTSHAVTYQTARTDLLNLEKFGLLHKFKRGKAFVFQSPNDMSERITELNQELMDQAN